MSDIKKFDRRVNLHINDFKSIVKFIYNYSRKYHKIKKDHYNKDFEEFIKYIKIILFVDECCIHKPKLDCGCGNIKCSHIKSLVCCYCSSEYCKDCIDNKKIFDVYCEICEENIICSNCINKDYTKLDKEELKKYGIYRWIRDDPNNYYICKICKITE